MPTLTFTEGDIAEIYVLLFSILKGFFSYFFGINFIQIRKHTFE